MDTATIEKNAVTAERERVRTITDLAGDDVPANILHECLDKGRTVEQSQSIFLESVRARPSIGSPAITVGDDLNLSSLPRAIGDAILARSHVTLYEQDHNGNILTDADEKPRTRQAHDRSRQFEGMPLIQIARTYLKANNVEGVDRMSDLTVSRKCFNEYGRSDFSAFTLPEILGDSMGRSLRSNYIEQPMIWNLFGRKNYANNFKNITRIQAGEISDLREINAHGEYSYSTISESKEVYKLLKFGTIVGISFETLLNDDLGVFDGIPLLFSQAARRKEDELAIGVLIDNDTMDDSVTLWNLATHKNLENVTKTQPSVATLNLARAWMRKQTGISSDAYLNLAPYSIIGPVAHEGRIVDLVGADSKVDPDNTDKSNPWKGKLKMGIHPRLDDDSSTAWYLASNPAICALVEVCFLSSEPGPVIETETSINTDARKYKLRHSIGVSSIDFRAGYKNPGA